MKIYQHSNQLYLIIEKFRFHLNKSINLSQQVITRQILNTNKLQ